MEQVQTVYRLLARAEPNSLEGLSLAITEGGGEAGGTAGEDERSWVFSGANKRKDETSRVLVYNSYIYPTLGTQQYGPPSTTHYPPHIKLQHFPNNLCEVIEVVFPDL